MTDIKSETIAHYLRMREWVIKRPEEETPDFFAMRREIGENPDGDFCPYCKYFIRCDSDIRSSCLLTSHVWGEHCCNNLWREMVRSSTWLEWLKAWEQLVYYICVFG